MLRKDSEAHVWDEVFRELKSEWRTMWLERYDDRVKAEGVARQDYSLLFVSRGTVVAATRRCKAPDFVEIVEQQRELSGVKPSSWYVNPSVGGWGRFIRSTLSTRCTHNPNRNQPFSLP